MFSQSAHQILKLRVRRIVVGRASALKVTRLLGQSFDDLLILAMVQVPGLSLSWINHHRTTDLVRHRRSVVLCKDSSTEL